MIKISPHRLKLLRSDLADLNNPKFLKKYPHLDKDEIREQLQEAIKRMEEKQ